MADGGRPRSQAGKALDILAAFRSRPPGTHPVRAQPPQVLAGPLEKWTPLTITDPGQLRRVLADVRRQGYAVSDRQVTMDALSVAAPVRGPGDEVAAALSLVVHSDGAQPAALAAPVRAAARGISRALGSPSAGRAPR